jgi:hypothetical protein
MISGTPMGCALPFHYPLSISPLAISSKQQCWELDVLRSRLKSRRVKFQRNGWATGSQCGWKFRSRSATDLRSRKSLGVRTFPFHIEICIARKNPGGGASGIGNRMQPPPHGAVADAGHQARLGIWFQFLNTPTRERNSVFMTWTTYRRLEHR